MNRKGAGYVLEAIIASLTLLVFVGGGFQAPEGQDWTTYRHQIETSDLTYVLKDTGDLKKFSKKNRPETLEAAANGITGDRFDVQGSIRGLPLGDIVVGFHVPIQDIYAQQSSVEDDCSTMPLDEVSDSEIREIETEPHSGSGVDLLLADTDPDISGGNNGEKDYDTVYVDNGSECQFTNSEGPYYKDEIIYWGDEGSDPGSFYDVKNISEEVLFYRADQPKEIGEKLQERLNGINTMTSIDTFNFSDSLSDYEVAVFRKKSGSGYTIDRIDRYSGKLKNFMEDGSALFLMNLKRNHFTGDFRFIEETGLEWVSLGWRSRPSKIDFPRHDDSAGKVSSFYRSLEDSDTVGLTPGGNISSGTSKGLAIAKDARYATSEWNATNFDMNKIGDPGETPENSCDYFRGDFNFPESTRTGVNMTLDCGGEKAAGVRIDLNGDGDTLENREGILVDGDLVEIGGRRYRVKTYKRGVEFVFAGPDRIEIVNYRKSFPGSSIERFARMPYRDSYSDSQLSLVASTIYWLSGTRESFGTAARNSIPSRVIGSINEDVYMPYRAQLRWYR